MREGRGERGREGGGREEGGRRGEGGGGGEGGLHMRSRLHYNYVEYGELEKKDFLAALVGAGVSNVAPFQLAGRNGGGEGVPSAGAGAVGDSTCVEGGGGPWGSLPRGDCCSGWVWGRLVQRPHRGEG